MINIYLFDFNKLDAKISACTNPEHPALISKTEQFFFNFIWSCNNTPDPGKINFWD